MFPHQTEFNIATMNGAAKANKRKVLSTKADSYLKNPEDVETLIELVKTLKENTAERESIILIAQTLQVVFKLLLINHQLCGASKHQAQLREQYEYALELLLVNFEHDSVPDAAQAFITSFEFLATEAKHPLTGAKQPIFPVVTLERILKALLSENKPMKHLMMHFKAYARHLDVLEHTWASLRGLANAAQFANPNFALNYLYIIETLNLKDSIISKSEYYCFTPTADKQFNISRTAHEVSQTWACLMSWYKQQPEKANQRLLLLLTERLLPHLEDSNMITELLMDGLNHKQAQLNLLALQCMYKPISVLQKTYKGVYTKLYSLFTDEVFRMKYKQRLFNLADLYLSLPHLPESLVAGFIKRFARLALSTAQPDTVMLLRFIETLLVRHQSLQVLITAETTQAMHADPYLEQAPNPCESCALNSCLWELALLQQHSTPAIANAAAFISQPLRSVEQDIDLSLDMAALDLFEQENGKPASQMTATPTYQRYQQQQQQQMEGDLADKYAQLI